MSNIKNTIDVSVIIVNYNCAPILKNCLNSILMQENVRVEIIVVDNASVDDSLKLLAGYGDRIKLIKSAKNVGFGCGNNLGFQFATGTFVYLMNPDAELLCKDDLLQLITYQNKHPEYGAIGTKIFNPDHTTSVLPKVSYPGENYYPQAFGVLPGKIAWLLGASLFCRREIYQHLQGFDESFFLYGEEVDFCLRARKQGYELGYCEQVAINHIGSYSESTHNDYKKWLRKQTGYHLFLKKYLPSQVIKRILIHTLIQAYYRKWLHFIKSQVPGLRASKYDRYRAIYDATKLCLRDF